MVSLRIKNISQQMYERIEAQARANHRTLNGEILFILEQAVFLLSIDVQAILARARRVRKFTAKYTW